MTDSELLFRSAVELAGLVRAGEVTARELAEASLERITALDPTLNAFPYVDADGALAAADAIGPRDERPFAGVPTAVKEITPAAGMPMTLCSDLLPGDYMPKSDAHVVRRLREAGFVIVGKTNSAELGILPVTEPRRFGATRNPWDLERTPGGSSGGAAAAVAAGIVPVAQGNDGGGSVRVPAACCGLVGLKPSRGRISRGPQLGDSFLATDGMLTRTVEDCAATLDVLAGYEPGDATWAPPAGEPFAQMAQREPGRLRIALSDAPLLLDCEIDPACSAAARDAGELLASLGHDVEELDPGWRPRGELFELFGDLWAPLTAGGVAFGALIAGREPRPEDVEPLTWALYERALETDSLRYLAALTIAQAHARRVVESLASYDLLVTPALATAPGPLGAIDGCGPDPMGEFRKSAEFTPYTALWNVTGQPAISLPLFEHDGGLPLGVQIVGPPLGEGLLLSVAAQLEAAHPWAERRPAAVASDR